MHFSDQHQRGGYSNQHRGRGQPWRGRGDHPHPYQRYDDRSGYRRGGQDNQGQWRQDGRRDFYNNRVHYAGFRGHSGERPPKYPHVDPDR